MSEADARLHIDRFNAAVTSGDWAPFLEGLAPDAVMTFSGGPPIGPFTGLPAVTAAYAADPPDDTMAIRSVRTEGATDAVAFSWSRGGTGTVSITWTAGLVTALAIDFD
jgi:hypothetical protein